MKILLLSPHTDDVELGAGGTVAKFVEEGHDITWAVFCTCEDAVPEGMDTDALRKEFIDVTKRMGIKNYEIFDFKNKHFPEQRQEILDKMHTMKLKINPDMVICPSLNDTHQDHNTIAMETFRCFKMSANIIGYEMPWNKINFSPTFFSPITKEHLRKKLYALKCYKTQEILNRSYFSSEFIKGLAKVRGVQSNNEYAEAFEVIRWKM